MARSRSPRRRYSDHKYPSDYEDRRHDRNHSRGREDGRIEEKLRKFDDRRRQDLEDSRYEWGAASSSKHEEEQKTNVSSRVENLEELKSGSFSRYADDERLNSTQKQQIRWDDPARGFVEEYKPRAQKHRYQPNRFNIPPGPHWDGMDRSNGFEGRLFRKRASNKVKTELGHQYAVQEY